MGEPAKWVNDPTRELEEGLKASNYYHSMPEGSTSFKVIGSSRNGSVFQLEFDDEFSTVMSFDKKGKLILGITEGE